MFRLSLTCFLLLLLHGVASEVFLNSDDASQVLNRRRRANSPFEEWRQGDMERECIEERCDREEAREIFEDEKQTVNYGDACESKPCVHNGVCKDGIGMYTCFCLSGFQGYNCEIDCDHFCHVKKDSVQCSCAE
uniref:coagulation factor Xa n=1 Tax=Hucho hucho TaxID=62062 RepID=A0A4W5LNH6_9TELE